MKLGLGFSELLTGPLQPVADEITHLIAGIRQGWFTEHDVDGHHTAINTQTIAFPSLAALSDNPTTLDAYAEGSWVPIDGSGAGLALTGAIGTYTRVGRLIHFNCAFTFPNTANGANATIGGLPGFKGSYTANNTTGWTVSYSTLNAVAQIILSKITLPPVLTFYKQDGTTQYHNTDFSLIEFRLAGVCIIGMT